MVVIMVKFKGGTSIAVGLCIYGSMLISGFVEGWGGPFGWASEREVG